MADVHGKWAIQIQRRRLYRNLHIFVFLLPLSYILVARRKCAENGRFVQFFFLVFSKNANVVFARFAYKFNVNSWSYFNYFHTKLTIKHSVWWRRTCLPSIVESNTHLGFFLSLVAALYAHVPIQKAQCTRSMDITTVQNIHIIYVFPQS